ncbi:MAG: hypothetical protein IRZ09_03715 [Variibacter sp.]|nr:hypothetical protein [Variibacter sp.]
MPIAIPPMLALALGMIASVAAARWLVQEARRINARLHPQDADDTAGAAEAPVGKLKRDPVTGIYRPE